MAEWQSGDVDVKGLRLHYTRTGGDKPALVLAHGFSDDGLCWTPVAHVLASDYDLVMVDARGHGRSDGPEQGYGSAEHAGDLAGVIEALGLVRPAVLGHSMGAATTLALAGTYAHMPRAILLEDPPPRWSSSWSEAPERAAGRHAWIVPLKRKTREELIADKRAESPGWSESELGPWADAKLRLSCHVLNRGGDAQVDWPKVIRSIICPTLLITADPELNSIVTPEDAAAFEKLLPSVRIVHIAGAGHNVRREQFADYMEIVRAFLAETTD